MSTVYTLEQPTKRKVILETTMGPIDIELWPKEAPKAIRNFVQLCLKGYYDRTIFHRVIKSFLVQGGDPTDSGTGGESTYGGRGVCWCDWLDRKNTIFGKVTGDSIFNLLRLGDVETDKDDRPLDPPKLLSVEILCWGKCG
ncbi:hypothetical protein J5N97_022358 [Dioscorea zingiberensis]|uniref:Peptidyl-prolyl cis-trans isomerase n=1 Tax=Dioscorea zingiberensis TaxID=325984 RepID=A0A9D5HAH4_9LILI|nr:hypothetical protein J5N97_022358 [Dioscorea zingiberensis]